jgi:hypothetical protein
MKFSTPRKLHRFWGAQAASLQISANCRDGEWRYLELCMQDVAGRITGK